MSIYSIPNISDENTAASSAMLIPIRRRKVSRSVQAVPAEIDALVAAPPSNSARFRGADGQFYRSEGQLSVSLSASERDDALDLYDKKLKAELIAFYPSFGKTTRKCESPLAPSAPTPSSSNMESAPSTASSSFSSLGSLRTCLPSTSTAATTSTSANSSSFVTSPPVPSVLSTSSTPSAITSSYKAKPFLVSREESTVPSPPISFLAEPVRCEPPKRPPPKPSASKITLSQSTLSGWVSVQPSSSTCAESTGDVTASASTSVAVAGPSRLHPSGRRNTPLTKLKQSSFKKQPLVIVSDNEQPIIVCSQSSTIEWLENIKKNALEGNVVHLQQTHFVVTLDSFYSHDDDSSKEEEHNFVEENVTDDKDNIEVQSEVDSDEEPKEIWPEEIVPAGPTYVAKSGLEWKCQPFPRTRSALTHWVKAFLKANILLFSVSIPGISYKTYGREETPEDQTCYGYSKGGKPCIQSKKQNGSTGGFRDCSSPHQAYSEMTEERNNPDMEEKHQTSQLEHELGAAGTELKSILGNQALRSLNEKKTAMTLITPLHWFYALYTKNYQWEIDEESKLY
ncbi:hypothetical protein FQR65_LT17909 [Abscondita terminalis]|nr:hypothetical protein FQR65_LT17909 [Abscondita terminalis]